MEPAETLDLNLAAQAIAGDPAPVLFVDTCALLDIIRCPMRSPGVDSLRGAGERSGRNAGAAGRIVTASETSPRGVWVVIPPPVEPEYQRNLPGVVEELDKHWRALDRNYERTPHVGRALGVEVPGPAMFEAGTAFLRGRLVGIADRMARGSVRLAVDDALRLRALTRAELAIAPGHRGVVSVADCTVVEHMLALADLLGEEIPRPFVFITSNADDFYSEGNRPKHPLDEEFERVGIDLVRDWEWAASRLGI